MFLCNLKKMWMIKHLSQTWPHHLLLSSSPLVFHLLSYFKAQPNCIPPVYSSSVETRVVPTTSAFQQYFSTTYPSIISPPHLLMVTQPPMIHLQWLSFPGSFTSPLLLRWCQQIKYRTCLHTSATSLPHHRLPAVLWATCKAGFSVDVKLLLAFFVN